MNSDDEPGSIKEDEENLPQLCHVLTDEKTGTKVYLIGTAHISEESCNDVRSIIGRVQPNAVVLELCSGRIHALDDDEDLQNKTAKQKLSEIFSMLWKYGPIPIMVFYLFSVYCRGGSKDDDDETVERSGVEMRAASDEASKLSDCPVILGDRHIDITVSRASACVPWYLKLGFFFLFPFILIYVLCTRPEPEALKSETERLKKELAEDLDDDEKSEEKVTTDNGDSSQKPWFPETSEALEEVILHERDTYLTYQLQTTAQNYENGTIVGVVGAAHLEGILDKWGTVTEEDMEKVSE